MKRIFLFIFLAILILGAGAALFLHGTGFKKSKPNIVIITIDTLRSDHCSTYGYKSKTTPIMDRIAGEGTRFVNSYSTMATTLPSHTTMFTSLFPITHGVLRNGFIVSPEHSTLAEILLQSGYTTAAFISSFTMDSKFGLNQGFQVYNDDFRGDMFKISRTWSSQKNAPVVPIDRRAGSTTQKVMKWLTVRRQKDKPFFLWVHYFDPHHPYQPPEPQRHRFEAPTQSNDVMKEIGAYDGEINYADQEMGKLIQGLEENRLTENTLVIITADHGEGLMQHGHMRHGLFIYEEAVRVPLIFSWPGKIPAGKVVTGPVQHTDLLPTVLDYAGIQMSRKQFQGISLVPYIEGNSHLDENRRMYFQRRMYNTGRHYGFMVQGEKIAIQEGDWKYIEAPDEHTYELYNLRNDPGELTNVYDRFPDKAKEMAGLLQSWKQANRKTPKIREAMSEEDQENLRALGYVQ